MRRRMKGYKSSKGDLVHGYLLRNLVDTLTLKLWAPRAGNLKGFSTGPLPDFKIIEMSGQLPSSLETRRRWDT